MFLYQVEQTFSYCVPNYTKYPIYLIIYNIININLHNNTLKFGLLFAEGKGDEESAGKQGYLKPRDIPSASTHSVTRVPYSNSHCLRAVDSPDVKSGNIVGHVDVSVG